MTFTSRSINREDFDAVIADLRDERVRVPERLRDDETGGYRKDAVMRAAHRAARRLHCAGMSYRWKLSTSLVSTWRDALMEGGRPYSVARFDRVDRLWAAFRTRSVGV